MKHNNFNLYRKFHFFRNILQPNTRILLIFGVIMLLTQCQGKLSKGSTAPDFTLKNTAQQAIRLSDYRGKVVLVHFWTDFCKSCRAEFPRIQEFYSELKSENFELLAINVGQPIRVSQTFQKDFQATFPMLTDPQGVMKDIYQLEAFPVNFFVSPEGKIIRLIKGWVDRKQVEVIIEQNKPKK